MGGWEAFETLVIELKEERREGAEAMRRASELERRAAAGLPEFKRFRLNMAATLRKVATGHEERAGRVVDRLEELQRADASVPRSSDFPKISHLREKLRRVQEERACLESRIARNGMRFGSAPGDRLELLDRRADLLITK